MAKILGTKCGTIFLFESSTLELQIQRADKQSLIVLWRLF